MQVDQDGLRETLLWLLDLLYDARKELVAYRSAHAVMSAAGLGRELDQFVELARKGPSPALLADHQAARDKVVELLREEKPDALLNILKNWKPTGFVN